MGSRFCTNEKGQYENIEEVRDAYPGATEIVEVEGGWMVFDTATDYEIWQNQK